VIGAFNWRAFNWRAYIRKGEERSDGNELYREIRGGPRRIWFKKEAGGNETNLQRELKRKSTVVRQAALAGT